jgi:hypothetical protein
MKMYAILRRNGWGTPGDLEEAAARSSAVGDGEMPPVADTLVVRPDPEAA